MTDSNSSPPPDRGRVDPASVASILRLPFEVRRSIFIYLLQIRRSPNPTNCVPEEVHSAYRFLVAEPSQHQDNTASLLQTCRQLRGELLGLIDSPACPVTILALRLRSRELEHNGGFNLPDGTPFAVLITQWLALPVPLRYIRNVYVEFHVDSELPRRDRCWHVRRGLRSPFWDACWKLTMDFISPKPQLASMKQSVDIEDEQNTCSLPTLKLDHLTVEIVTGALASSTEDNEANSKFISPHYIYNLFFGGIPIALTYKRYADLFYESIGQLQLRFGDKTTC